MEMTIGDLILRSLRAQAWERAKGELHAVAATFFSHGENSRPNQFENFMMEMERFIVHIEGNGLTE